VSGFDPTDDFDAHLQRRSTLQRHLTELDRLEPPAEVDEFVLAKARDAIEAPSPAPVFTPMRWAAPFALAASVLIAIGVVFLQRSRPAPRPASSSQLSEEVTVTGRRREAAAPMQSAPVAVAPAVAAPPAVAPPPEAAGEVEPAFMAARSSAAAKRLSPQQWMRQIDALRAAGQSEEADRQLTLLRQTYPKFRVPPQPR